MFLSKSQNIFQSECSSCHIFGFSLPIYDAISYFEVCIKVGLLFDSEQCDYAYHKYQNQGSENTEKSCYSKGYSFYTKIFQTFYRQCCDFYEKFPDFSLKFFNVLKKFPDLYGKFPQTNVQYRVLDPYCMLNETFMVVPNHDAATHNPAQGAGKDFNLKNSKITRNSL